MSLPRLDVAEHEILMVRVSEGKPGGCQGAQGLTAGRDQLVDEELCSPVGLCCRVEPGCHRQVLGDVSLPSSRRGVCVAHRWACWIGSG
jgi:hypothetical protein